MPFEFALSNGAPMYRRLPTRSEWAKEENQFGPAGSFKPQSWGNRGHEHLALNSPIKATQRKLPWFLEKGGSVGNESTLGLVRRQIPHGSMLAYTKSFEHDGRTWLFSSDGTIVPADRVRKFRVSSFQGVDLTSSVKLPLAFFRVKARTKYQKTEKGFESTGREWAVRSWVPLANADPVERGGKSYLLTQELDATGKPLYTLEDDATVIRVREQAPIGVESGQKWLIVSITEGTLVAYEGMKPVYATLISPGAGGVPVPGKNPVKMSTTPLGVYRVTFKHLASTMSPEQGEKRKFWIADVPYTQYFNAPFALHTAYWHEKFGEPMSAGCVNLSPLDGKRLFDWTEPRVPAGWAGAGPGGANGVGTFVVIAR
jgi:lipoprotein-anchoring transpeptidase ErfK/SrfK